MNVYVVMSNDYPNCVFGTEADAKAYVAKRKIEDNPTGAGGYRRIYWRYYEYLLDREGHPV